MTDVESDAGSPVPEPRFARVDGWVWRWRGDTVLTLGPDGDRRRLGGLVGAIWAVLDEPRSCAEVRRALLQVGATAGSPARSTAVGGPAVDDAMAGLVEAGLVARLPRSAPGGGR